MWDSSEPGELFSHPALLLSKLDVSSFPCFSRISSEDTFVFPAASRRAWCSPLGHLGVLLPFFVRLGRPFGPRNFTESSHIVFRKLTPLLPVSCPRPPEHPIEIRNRTLPSTRNARPCLAIIMVPQALGVMLLTSPPSLVTVAQYFSHQC